MTGAGAATVGIGQGMLGGAAEGRLAAGVTGACACAWEEGGRVWWIAGDWCADDDGVVCDCVGDADWVAAAATETDAAGGLGADGRGLLDAVVAPAGVSGSRRRLVPRVVLSLRPMEVAFRRIWCLGAAMLSEELVSRNGALTSCESFPIG